MIQAWKSIVSFLVSGMVGSWVGVGVHNNPNWLIFLVGNHGTNTANPKTLCTPGCSPPGRHPGAVGWPDAMWNAYERRWAALTCRTCNQTVSWKGDCSADFHRSFCRQWLLQVDYNGCIAGLCFPRTWFISLFLISFFFQFFSTFSVVSGVVSSGIQVVSPAGPVATEGLVRIHRHWPRCGPSGGWESGQHGHCGSMGKAIDYRVSGR